jgi:hypothetical protein
MATTQTDPNSGTHHRHGLTATDTQIKGLASTTSLATEVSARALADGKLQAAIDALTARVAILEGDAVPPPVIVPPDPGIPGPIPVGTTPPKAMRDIIATGGDATAATISWLRSAPTLDLDGLKPKVKQLDMLGWKDASLTSAAPGAQIIQTTASLPTGPGLAANLWWLHGGCANLSFSKIGFVGASDGKPVTHEYNHCFAAAVHGLTITDCTIDHFGGDGIYCDGDTQWTTDAKILRNVITYCGRMGLGVANGLERAVVSGNTFDVFGWYATMDIEPNCAPVGGKAPLFANIEFSGNKIGRGNASKWTWVDTKASCNAGAYGAVLSNVVVKDNVTMYADTPWNVVNSYGSVVSFSNNH